MPILFSLPPLLAQTLGGSPQAFLKTDDEAASGGYPLSLWGSAQAGGTREKPQGFDPQEQQPYHSAEAGQREVCAANPTHVNVCPSKDNTDILYLHSHAGLYWG